MLKPYIVLKKIPTQSATHFSDILYIILILGDSEDDMNTAPKDMQSKLVTNPASDTSSPGNEILFLTCTSLPQSVAFLFLTNYCNEVSFYYTFSRTWLARGYLAPDS